MRREVLMAGGILVGACSAPESAQPVDPELTEEALLGYKSYASLACASLSPEHKSLLEEDASFGLLKNEIISYEEIITLDSQEGLDRMYQVAADVYDKANHFLPVGYKLDVGQLGYQFMGETCTSKEAQESNYFLNAFAFRPEDQAKTGIQIGLETYPDAPIPVAILEQILIHEAGHHILFSVQGLTETNSWPARIDESGYSDGFFETVFYEAIKDRLPAIATDIETIRGSDLPGVNKYAEVQVAVQNGVAILDNESLSFVDTFAVMDESKFGFYGGHAYDNVDEAFASIFALYMLAPDSLAAKVNELYLAHPSVLPDGQPDYDNPAWNALNMLRAFNDSLNRAHVSADPDNRDHLSSSQFISSNSKDLDDLIMHGFND